MRFTTSISNNRQFQRLYRSGKHAVDGFFAIYCHRNRVGGNRLGLTVSTKIGKAVVRNRVRRRMKEIYRLQETQLGRGWDVVIVARVRARYATYVQLEQSFRKLTDKLGLRT